MLFDFRKAFDLIDHNILAKKLLTYNIPETIKYWILDFLSNRKQRVKLGNDCQSEWSTVHAGVPQSTKLGPWLFAIMVDEMYLVWTISGDMSMTPLCLSQLQKMIRPYFKAM